MNSTIRVFADDKIQNGHCPNYLSVSVPDSVGNISHYSLRNVEDTQLVPALSSITAHFSLVFSVSGIVRPKKSVMQRL